MRPPRLALAALALAACSFAPPARFAQGGAPLELPRARWAAPGLTVDLLDDGRVLVDGEPTMRLDRAGRVTSTDGEPLALLEPDGRVTGLDERPLGTVGLLHASPPDRETAWLTVAESGEVVSYDADGERRAYGVWAGCGPTPGAHHACTLVTHLVAMQLVSRPRYGGVSFGVGVGVRVR